MGNSLIRIILQSDQIGDFPEQKVILDHEIDGFLTKKDLSIQHLTIMVYTTLRAYRDLLIIEKRRQIKATELEAVSQERNAMQTRINELEDELTSRKPLAS